MLDDRQVEALGDFIDQLIDLRERAGDPSLPELRRLSERAYVHGGRGVVLAQSTTHDILSRKRRCWPKWSWVASYFNACRVAAEETGLPVEPLGTLEDWNDRLRAAKAGIGQRHVIPHHSEVPGHNEYATDGYETVRNPALRSVPLALSPESFTALATTIHRGPLGIESPPAEHPPSGTPLPAKPARSPAAPIPAQSPPAAVSNPSAVSVTPSVVTALSVPPAGLAAPSVSASVVPAHRMAAPAEHGRSLSQQRYQQAYGSYGVGLLDAAESGDDEAAYRLGVLLATDQRPNESTAWLQQAAQRRHAAAAQLLDGQWQVREDTAAEHAYLLAEQADRADDPSTAMIYYECAARCRHPDAALRLGAIHRDRGRLGEAGYWFGQADAATRLSAERGGEIAARGGEVSAGPVTESAEPSDSEARSVDPA